MTVVQSKNPNTSRRPINSRPPKCVQYAFNQWKLATLQLYQVWEGAAKHLRIPSADDATQTDLLIDPKPDQNRPKLQTKYLKKLLQA